MDETKVSLKKAIDKEVPKIINSVIAFASRHREAITRTRDGKKQFNDLVEASAQACCIDEFKLYIKYKGAKEGTRSLWGGLATHFNSAIDELMKQVEDNISNGIDKDKYQVDHETVRLEVLRRFCGYLMWRANADIADRGGERV